ncbi:MAG TPA: hypothetical protein VLM40_16395, partial [Gemmata sp.]|nr:hypothetical protein [Gemmata sp.]
AQPLGARDEAVFVVEGNRPTELIAELQRLSAFSGENNGRNIEAVARRWFREPRSSAGPLAVAFVARSTAELTEQTGFAIESLRLNPTAVFAASAKPTLRDRVFYSPEPLGPKSKVAFVYPGSGNHFAGMGRELSVQWPEVLRRQQSENEILRSQFAPEMFWNESCREIPNRLLMFGQVAVGSLVSDIAVSLGVKPHAMIGLSLGESAGLFGVRAWQSRDEMLRRMQGSTLFNSDLAPPYNAARQHWHLRESDDVDWAIGVVAAAPDEVARALRRGLRAFLLIVNTPGECVIGGVRKDLEQLAAAIGKPVTLLTGVTLAHCEAGRPVEGPYRDLHTLPVTRPDVAIFSGAWGKSYEPTDDRCAASITAGLVQTIDFPAVLEAAYRDGVRVFVEVGPGNSCTRMIDAILGNRSHLARAAHVPRQETVLQVLRLVAQLVAERIPVDLAALYGGESHCVGHREPRQRAREIVIPVGQVPERHEDPTPQHPPPGSEGEKDRTPHPIDRKGEGSPVLAFTPPVEAAANLQVLTAQAQAAYLRVTQRYTETAASLLHVQTRLLGMMAGSQESGVRSQERGKAFSPAWSPNSDPRLPTSGSIPRALNFKQCCTFATGKVADVLGVQYAEIDAFPTRVRLPDGPLQLVDRINLIEGEPLSMKPGRVVTEHAVRADRWYLEAGRIPTAIAVEAGQADLFLSGFLGIDLQTRGLAVYRLLDAVVTFHRGLPRIGETVVYDIHIDEFVKQGEAWIFRFRFDGTVNGEPFLSMRNGVAGFFTAEALAAGRGIVQTALDRKPMPGKRPADWRDLVPQGKCSLSPEQVDALRSRDLAAAFGPQFASLPLAKPATLPGEMLRLVDRVPLIDPDGGRFGIGFVRAEFDVRPDDWFLTCHFVDDQVMPGTLMYECCLHTLRILLMRMGWVGAEGEVACEPVPGVQSRLKCRGQVIASTRTVTYEVTVKELGYGPEPFCIADALMYADGKPIVEISNMSLRMSGLTRAKLDATWAAQPNRPISFPRSEGGESPRYDSAKILAFSNGNPSEAFGEPYRVFDRDRVIARLPGPPFQFLDCITAVSGEPFAMKAGASCEARYDVPEAAWYFTANRSEKMPFAVLLEIALQPCGWLAAYCGSALTSAEDLSFRNLGGKATQFRAVTPTTGTLLTTVQLTSVSSSAGMIIQHYNMKVRDAVGLVYEGTTYFGFFSKAALANQVGIRDARVPRLTQEHGASSETVRLPLDPPFPAPKLRMIDRIEAFIPDGGRAGLGLVVGKIAVDPGFWFFKAHFYQDPVWPGSLGLESFLQLLKYVAWKRFRRVPEGGFQTVALTRPHSWVYRGQVLPSDREVTVVLEITAADDSGLYLTADGFLIVDGRVIYQMTDFTLQ